MAKTQRNGKLRFTARTADRYTLYQLSVQEPEHEVEFFDKVYRQAYRRAPKTLREDFCGTFAVCCAWAKKRGRTALGVDLDPEPLEWGRKFNLSRIPDEAQQRVTLVQEDVRTVGKEKVDLLAAQNFSFWIFKTRDELRDYFKIAHKNLGPEGMMVLDMMGGGECYVEGQKDRRKIPGDKTREGFTYIWEQHAFNPITHDASFYIHFEFKDGTKLKRAFEYHWRFWTIPEVRELLHEAGFSTTYVYWEGTDKNGEGDNDWQRAVDAPSDPSWISYLVALR